MGQWGAYLKMSLVHPWYPTLMRLSAVDDLRCSLLDEIKKILKPLPLILLKNLRESPMAGALFLLIHSSKLVTFNFSPLIINQSFPFTKVRTLHAIPTPNPYLLNIAHALLLPSHFHYFDLIFSDSFFFLAKVKWGRGIFLCSSKMSFGRQCPSPNMGHSWVEPMTQHGHKAFVGTALGSLESHGLG